MINKALIVGGGIGGMSAALCLAREGVEVDVFEQASEFNETGAGIQLSPNCTRVLHYLGLEEQLSIAGFLPEAVEMRHWASGKVIARTPLGQHALETFGFPYYHIHRQDLLAILLSAAEKHPAINLHTGERVDQFIQSRHGVSIDTNDGNYSADFLVGADGIHSLLRNQLFGSDAPVFTGNIAWRLMVPVGRLPQDLIRPVATAWWGPHKHFVHYLVGDGEWVNCICVVEKKGWEEESWTSKGSHGELIADFSGWHETVETLVAHADPENCFKWALFDRPPMKKWSRGRVTLLGDACHPTLPFLAQGAAMAIEDAAVLARCVTDGVSIEQGLQRYESLRIGRTASIQLGSRRNSGIFHMSGMKAWLRDRAADKMSRAVTDRIYQYDVFSAMA